MILYEDSLAASSKEDTLAAGVLMPADDAGRWLVGTKTTCGGTGAGYGCLNESDWSKFYIWRKRENFSKSDAYI